MRAVDLEIREHPDVRARVHIGVLALAIAAYGPVVLVATASPYAAGAIALAIAVGALYAGFRIERSPLAGVDSLVGLLWVISAAFVVVAVVGLAGSVGEVAPGVVLAVAVISTVYTGALYLLNGSGWLVCAFIGSVAGLFAAALSMRPGIPLAATGFVLLLLAAYAGIGAARGVLRPDVWTYVGAMAVGTVGALVLLSEGNAIGFIAAVVVAVVLLRGTLESAGLWRRRSRVATLEIGYPAATVFDALSAGLMHQHVTVQLSDPVSGRIVASTATGGTLRLELRPDGTTRTRIRAIGDVDGVPELIDDVRAALDFVAA
jgi:hypothetical protein